MNNLGRKEAVETVIVSILVAAGVKLVETIIERALNKKRPRRKKDSAQRAERSGNAGQRKKDSRASTGDAHE